MTTIDDRKLPQPQQPAYPAVASGKMALPNALPEVVFGADQSRFALDLTEVWQHRELLSFLVWRDIKVRYKQTVLGAVWAVLKPLMTMVAFSIVFGAFVRIPSGGIPYPVFTYTALILWTFFTSALAQAGSSLVANANLISKVYFPRLIIPLASVLSATVDFAIAFVVLIIMMLVYRIVPSIAILTIPLFLLLALLTALGGGLWLSAAQVKYRDVGHIIPFVIQLWLFATPVAYPISLVPTHWLWFYRLNPMVGVVEGFRWALLGTDKAPIDLILSSTAVVLLLLISGLFYFKRAEHNFADLV